MVGKPEIRLWRLANDDFVFRFGFEANKVVCKKDPEGIEKKAARLYFSVLLYLCVFPVWLVVRLLMALTTDQAGLFMCKNEIFVDVLSVVCDVTGLSEEEVLRSKTEESTDARFLLVKYLWRLMPVVCIGKLIGRTRQGVRAILQREKGDTWLMTRNWKEIVKRLESKGF